MNRRFLRGNIEGYDRQSFDLRRGRCARRVMKVTFTLLSLIAAAAFAQLAPQTPQAAYEGQPVSAVSMIANPHRDLEPLRPYITQKRGEPYSQAKIQATARGGKIFLLYQALTGSGPSG